MIALTQPKPDTRTSTYEGGDGLAVPRIDGLPLMKPPYGRITAYDMNKGEIAWQIANGDTPPAIKNIPALKGLNIPRTGSPSHAGILVTKTLLFAGEGWGGLPMFRAYDKATGQIIWETHSGRDAKQSADDLHAPGAPVHRFHRRRCRDVVTRAAGGVRAAAASRRPGESRSGTAMTVG